MVRTAYTPIGMYQRLLAGCIVLAIIHVCNMESAYAIDPPKCENGEDPSINAILGEGNNFLAPLPPISDHYTRKILMRAEAGIREAEKLPHTFSESAFDFDTELRSTFATYANPDIMDTDARVIKQEQDLREVTFCLHVDLLLIETMMQKVQCRIQYAFEQKKIATIQELQSLMKFLSDRYNALLRSAHDNTYRDNDWWIKQSSDADEYESWCCRSSHESGEACEPFWNWQSNVECQGQSFGKMTACEEESTCTEWQMCPFHSDYLPPTVFVLETPYEENGQTKVRSDIVEYGCDLYALSRFEPILGKDAENDAIKSYTKLDEVWEAEYKNMYRALEKRDALVSKASSVKEHTINLREWLGQQCSRRLMYFGEVRMPTDPQEAEARHRVRIGCNGEDGDVIIPLPKLPPEPEQEGEKDTYDPNISYGPPDWPPGLIRWELRGPFSLEKNELQLVRNYAGLRVFWGENRPLWVEEAEDSDGQWVDRLFNPLRRYMTDLYFYNWDPHQEQMEGTITPKASDATAQIVRELQPARSAIGELSRTANSLRGVRGFARSFTYFLRRSCIFRPCNNRLDQILKVIFSDACFPYTNGEYLTNPEIIEACRNEVRQQ